MSRRDHDKRHKRKLEIVALTGAVRMPCVPHTMEDLYTISQRSEFSIEELLARDDVELGLVSYDENFLREISVVPAEPMLGSRKSKRAG